jgi:hypothetical protein
VRVGRGGDHGADEDGEEVSDDEESWEEGRTSLL